MAPFKVFFFYYSTKSPISLFFLILVFIENKKKTKKAGPSTVLWGTPQDLETEEEVWL